MITFVCWKWTDPRAGRSFSSSHVNVLARSIARNYPLPHRFVCITDEPEGLSPEIVHLPMPVTGFEHLLNPESTRGVRPAIASRRIGRRVMPGRPAREPKPFPSCYRRLWNFSEQARALLGPRIFAIDIDVIVLRDLRPLIERAGSFVGWVDPQRFEWKKVAGGAYMLETGKHVDVWRDFDPERSPAIATEAGYCGSDQAWMSYKLHDTIPYGQHWTSSDGLMKLKWLRDRRPSADMRLIFTNGNAPPWDPEVQRRYPWITEYWR